MIDQIEDRQSTARGVDNGGAPLAALMALYGILGIELTYSSGHYNFTSLAIITVAVAFVAMQAFYQCGDFDEVSWVAIAWGLAVVFGYHLLRHHEVIYANPGFAIETVHQASILGFVSVAAMGVFYWSGTDRKWLYTSFGLACISFTIAMFAVLWASPDPHIDVFMQLTKASNFLGDGLNPYSQSYPEFYGGRYGYPQGLNYPPGVLWWAAPAQWIVGDVRAGHIIAEIVGCAGLWFLGRDLNIPRADRTFWIVAWLAFPVRFFVLEQSWIDSFIIAFLPFLLWSLLHKKWLLAGILLGLLCTMKQYAVFVVGLTLVHVWFAADLTRMLKLGLVCTGVFGLHAVPFALLDWQSFYVHTFGHYLEVGPRGDALTWIAYSMNQHNFTPPGLLMTVAYVTPGLALAFWLSRDDSLNLEKLTLAFVLQYAVTFLFGKQAFCNYYYLLAFFTLLAAFVHTRR